MADSPGRRVRPSPWDRRALARLGGLAALSAAGGAGLVSALWSTDPSTASPLDGAGWIALGALGGLVVGAIGQVGAWIREGGPAVSISVDRAMRSRRLPPETDRGWVDALHRREERYTSDRWWCPAVVALLILLTVLQMIGHDFDPGWWPLLVFWIALGVAGTLHAWLRLPVARDLLDRVAIRRHEAALAARSDSPAPAR